MRLFALAALLAVCGAAKLDRTYLPPTSSQSAGGVPGDLQTPFARSTQNNQGLGGLPTGAYNNDFGGVVVDASSAGTRAAGPGESGLGAPRQSYGSQASKVGDAAFRQSQNAGFRNPGLFQANGEAETAQGFVPQPAYPERQQAAQDRAANIIRFDSEVGPESFNYAFETDNGITAEESGVATNGVQAQGAFSYTSDDGQTYSVSYTADENGYHPKGDHLPTPPPIPEAILKSLEKNAQDEAAGLIDDGSYDAHKYNAPDYNESDNKGQYNERQSSVGSGNRATSDTAVISPFVRQSTFAQQNADATNNREGNFQQSASNNAPGQFAKLAQSGSQQTAFGHPTAQVTIGSNQNQAQSNFAYLPPVAQANSQAQASFSGFRSQQLNQPNVQSNQGFSRPSHVSSSASFDSNKVNEQPTGSIDTASFQTQFQSKSQAQNYPSHTSAKVTQGQNLRPTQQPDLIPLIPQFNSNQNVPSFAQTPTQSASAYTSINAQQSQYTNSQAFPTRTPQVQNQQYNQFSSKQVQSNQFNQPQLALSNQQSGYAFQNTRDNSYAYNQPAQPFRTPSGPEGIQNPTQFDRLAQSYSASSNAQFGSFPTQSSISQKGSSRYPNPPTLPAAAPTVSIQTESSHDHFNGVTQATASSFSANVNQAQTFQRPNQNTISSQNPTQQPLSQEAQSTPSQQYDGELYDYSKPADSLTTPKDSNPEGTELIDAEVSPTQNTEAFAFAEYKGTVPGYAQESEDVASLNRDTTVPEFQGQTVQGSAEYNQGQIAPGFSQNSAAAVTGKGEVFGGPRQPPSYDETGYHY